MNHPSKLTPPFITINDTTLRDGEQSAGVVQTIFMLPYVLLAATVMGIVYSIYLEKFQPERYRKLGQVFEHLG